MANTVAISRKIYKIATHQQFYKWVKKENAFHKYVSDAFEPVTFKTAEEAQAWIDNKGSLNIGGDNRSHHVKLAGANTYKMTYDTTKTFRILSYQICEFLNVISEEEGLNIVETKKLY